MPDPSPHATVAPVPPCQTISLIVAIDREGSIGKEGQIPWRSKTDMARFRALTMGKPLILGRVTFESIGRPLPGRQIIVLTRRAAYVLPDWAPDDVRVAPSLDAALGLVPDAPEVMIGGGEQVYREAWGRATRFFVTIIDGTFGGDRTFSPIHSLGSFPVSDKDSHAGIFFCLEGAPPSATPPPPREEGQADDDGAKAALPVVPGAADRLTFLRDLLPRSRIPPLSAEEKASLRAIAERDPLLAWHMANPSRLSSHGEVAPLPPREAPAVTFALDVTTPISLAVIPMHWRDRLAQLRVEACQDGWFFGAGQGIAQATFASASAILAALDAQCAEPVSFAIDPAVATGEVQIGTVQTDRWSLRVGPVQTVMKVAGREEETLPADLVASEVVRRLVEALFASLESAGS